MDIPQYWSWQMLEPWFKITLIVTGVKLLDAKIFFFFFMLYFILVYILACSSESHPIYLADGICLYSYLGMDH